MKRLLGLALLSLRLLVLRLLGQFLRALGLQALVDGVGLPEHDRGLRLVNS